MSDSFTQSGYGEHYTIGKTATTGTDSKSLAVETAWVIQPRWVDLLVQKAVELASPGRAGY